MFLQDLIFPQFAVFFWEMPMDKYDEQKPEYLQ